MIVSKMNECYSALYEALASSKHSIASMFMLLKLCTYAEKYESKLNITFKKQSRDFAIAIQRIDQYMGYLAWAEIYIS